MITPIIRVLLLTRPRAAPLGSRHAARQWQRPDCRPIKRSTTRSEELAKTRSGEIVASSAEIATRSIEKLREVAEEATPCQHESLSSAVLGAPSPHLRRLSSAVLGAGNATVGDLDGKE